MINTGDILHGKYEIGNLAGEGGMSKVWFAKELSNNKLWAVKDIDKTSMKFKSMANPDGTLTEVEIVKDLNHPFIPRVNDVYEDDTSIQIVMEYVKGKSLKEVAEAAGPIDEKHVVEWAKDMAEIFIYLHTREKPVIYRDLKPGNVILKKDNQIRLLDFGIAVLADPVTHEAKTRPMGTRGFASPEHFKGIVTEKSDVYTLGKTILCLISGKNPIPLSAEDGPDYSRVSKGLEKIIRKATEEDPDMRYTSMSAMLKDLITYNQKKKSSFMDLFR